MSFAEAVVLGVVQGITEFLPVSSSGHLVLLPVLLGWEDQGLVFDVVVHVATLVAIVAFFWNDFQRMGLDLMRDLAARLKFKVGSKREVKGQYQGARFSKPHASMGYQWSASSRLVGLLILASVPIALVGVLLKGSIENEFRSAFWVGCFFFTVGLLFMAGTYWLERQTVMKQADQLKPRFALAIGLAQALAVFPGVSRSGVTIFAGVGVGLSRTEAARFSFLLSIPAILGALLVSGLDLIGHPLPEPWYIYVTGFVSAASSGYLAIRFMFVFLRRFTLRPFGWYLLLMAVVAWTS